MKEGKYLSEEDRRLLRERFAHLQAQTTEPEPEERIDSNDIKTKVLAAAQKKLNEGEALETIFEFCFEAGRKVGA